MAADPHPGRGRRAGHRNDEAAPLSERLDLADWRRAIATLYAEVRARSAADPAAAWQLWRDARERLYREHPQSPVPASERRDFRARHWRYDPAYRFEVEVEVDVASDRGGAPAAAEGPVAAASPGAGAAAVAPIAYAQEPAALPSSVAGAELSFARVGRVTVPFPGGTRWLGLYWLAGYAGGLFLAFRDATNGLETYGAGRYLLDAAKSADLGGSFERLVLDFNFAYHPSCAFDPKWACPLAPLENRLDIRVEAGERLHG